MFHLAATLCENGGTLDVVVKSKDIFVLRIVPNPNSKAKCTRCQRFNLNFDMQLWPNFMTFKCDQLLIRVMLLLMWWWCIMKKEFKGALTHRYQPHMVLLDFDVGQSCYHNNTFWVLRLTFTTTY
jgi:hypothetical protein